MAESTASINIRREATRLIAEERSTGLMAAFLVGSATTGELCPAPDTSDTDVVLVVAPEVNEPACVEMKARLRSAFARLNLPPPGLRCRYPDELVGFSRYLLLQGYDSALAIRLLEGGADLALPKPDVSPSTRAEVLCVLGETLWTEVRYRLGEPPSDDTALYSAAKTALAYATLILTAQGIFLPTHAARVARLALLQPQLADQLNQALATKMGDFTPWPSAWDPVAQLRRVTLNAVEVAAPTSGSFDAAQFWSDPPARFEPLSRDEEMNRINQSMERFLEGVDAGVVVVPSDDGLFRAGMPAGAVPPFLHATRLRLSRAARRDWGHIHPTYHSPLRAT
jgi:hypothetical protein